MRRYHIIGAFLSLLLFSCKGEHLFKQAPTVRSDAYVQALKEELVGAEYGWRVIYFPRTDSLIFNDYKRNYQESEFISGEMGYGGRYFHMRFFEDGTVEMLSDGTENEVTTSRRSKYEVTQSAVAKLSFTTYNYLHALVNSGFQGSSDFFYLRREQNGDILMSTFSYTEVEREYILFQKLPTAEAWSEDIRKAYENRKFFEERRNFQIKIHQGDRIFYTSDRNFRDAIVKGDLLRPYREESLGKRYHLFAFTSVQPLYSGDRRIRFAVLGSGYTGTHEGLTFRSGIRLGSQYTFRSFKREGDHFVCELVRIYDPLYRVWKLESKHHYPDGEPTGMVAHIYPTH